MVWIWKSIPLTRRPIEYCLYRCACVCRGPIWQSMLSRIKQRSSMCKCFVCLRTIHFPCIQTLKRRLDQALDPESHLDPAALDPESPRDPAALDPPSPLSLQLLSITPSPLSIQPSPLSIQPSPLSLQPSPLSIQPSPLSTRPPPCTLHPLPTPLQPPP